MSEVEGKTVECDRCGKQTERSKIIQDKGLDYPDLLKKAKDDDRDFINLCLVCADVDMVDDDDDTGVDKEMSNVRQFL